MRYGGNLPYIRYLFLSGKVHSNIGVWAESRFQDKNKDGGGEYAPAKFFVIRTNY